MKKHPWVAIIAGVLVGSLMIVPLAFSQPQTPAYQGQPALFSSISAPFVDAGVLRAASETRVCTSSGNFYVECGSIFWNPGGTIQTVLTGGVVTHSATWQAPTFKATAADGVDGVLFSSEAEIQWPDTKIAEVGTALQFTATELQNNAAGTTQMVYRSLLADATATPTVCGHVMATNVAYAQGDCLESLSNSAGTTYMRMYEGDGAAVTAGTSTTPAHVDSTLTVDTTANGNAADTTEDNLTAYSVPANVLATNGRGIHFVFWGDNNGGVTADVETIRCYFGHATVLKSGTLLVTRVLTASQANTWSVVADVVRTGAATQVATATLNQGGTVVATVQTNSAPSGTLSGATLAGCTGQRATTSSANSLRQLGLVAIAF